MSEKPSTTNYIMTALGLIIVFWYIISGVIDIYRVEKQNYEMWHDAKPIEPYKRDSALEAAFRYNDSISAVLDEKARIRYYEKRSE